MQKLSFKGTFINFSQRWGNQSKFTRVELREHEICSCFLSYSLQNVSIYLYSNDFFNHMTIYKSLDCISLENLYIKSLFTEIGALTVSH